MDEGFVTMLRERVDAVAPVIDVDTSRVVPRARRRRVLVRTTALAVAAGLVATGAAWAAGRTDGGGGSTPPAGWAGGPEDVGTVEDPRDAPFWHVAYEELDEAGAVSARMDLWYGRTEPGVALVDGEPAWAMGQASWGALKLDAVALDGDVRVTSDGWTLVTWDVLDQLPTDPAALEQLLRGSIEPGRGAGTDDDKVFDTALGLLRGSPASTGLRLALWDVATGLPGGDVHEDVMDSRGRPATMIDRPITGSGETRQYWFDPADGRLLEVLEAPSPEEVAAARDADAIVMGWHAVYLEEGPAEDTPVEPTLELAGCASWETC